MSTKMSPSMMRVVLSISLLLAACTSDSPSPTPVDDDDDTEEDGDESGETPEPDARVTPRVDAGGKLDARVPEPVGSSDAGDAGDTGTTIAPTDASVTKDASVVDGGAVTPDAGNPAERPDPGKGDGKDVVTIGDSWMSNTLQLEGTGGGISPSLRRASGQSYPNYARQGVMLLTTSAFGPAIPTQWDAALRANKEIKTVVMTAGGNDIIQNAGLQEDCKNGGDTCKAKLEEIGKALQTLWAKMAAAGVQDIVHVLYANSAGDGLKDADANNMGLQKLCDAVPAPTRCHLVGTDDLVMNSIAIDGIHPTTAANDRMAKAIYQLMEKERMRR
jgi:lysophospholipase L1-like esterase